MHPIGLADRIVRVPGSVVLLATLAAAVFLERQAQALGRRGARRRRGEVA